MKLEDGPALLVLSGQGMGSGVAHFTSPVSFEADYPPLELLETWCSLTDPVIPKTPEEIVLMAARQCTSDGTPWTILSEYVQANLKRSRRGKHYAGVGLAVKGHTLPVEAIPLIHDILVSMLLAKMDEGHFIESLEDWHPSAKLLKAVRALPVEALRPGFEGVQPGVEEAKIIHSMQAQSIVRDSQELTEYRDFCAIFVIRRQGQPEKDSCYVRSPYDVRLWEESLSPVTPPPAQSTEAAPLLSTASLSYEERDNGEIHLGNRGRYNSPTLAIVSSDLQLLEGRVADLARRVHKLEIEPMEDMKSGKSNFLEIVVTFVLILLVVLIVLTLIRDSFSDRGPVLLPADTSQSSLGSTTPDVQPNGTSSSQNADDLNLAAQSGSNENIGAAAAPPAESEVANSPLPEVVFPSR